MNRILPGVSFTAQLSGAVHKYVVTIPLAVMRRVRRSWRRAYKAQLKRERGW